MKIREKCSCGAEFEAGDSRGKYINDGGKPDENGDIYVIERHLREFRAVHFPCSKGEERKATDG